MKIASTFIPDVLLIEPQVFGDQRGFFFESFNEKRWLRETGLDIRFVQDNHSHSEKGTLRGLHYQVKQPQGKLVRVVQGEVFDVSVDLRKSSPFFGKWVGIHLSAENKQMLWIPAGFAHGFLVLSNTADFLYKTTEFYAPEYEKTIYWQDPDLAIEWPLNGTPLLSAKDSQGQAFKESACFP